MPGRTLVLSPHLDDAAFCLGAALLDGTLGEVEVVNIFTVSDYAATSVAGNAPQVTRLRRLEDDRFFARVPGVRRTDLGQLDAPLRLGIPWQSVCDKRNLRGNEEVIATLMTVIDSVIRRKEGQVLVLAPLGLGHHIDHRVVRQAAVRHWRAGGSVGFYEDLPYAASLTLPAVEAAVADVARIARRKLAPHLLLARCRPAPKARVIRVYRSQLSDSTVQGVLAHGARLDAQGFAERIWLGARASALLSAR